MCRNRKGFHSPLILDAVMADFGKDDCQCHTFARAHIFNCDIQLQNAPKGFQIRVPYINHHRILASIDG